jgi:hypothetical protein
MDEELMLRECLSSHSSVREYGIPKARVSSLKTGRTRGIFSCCHCDFGCYRCIYLL